MITLHKFYKSVDKSRLVMCTNKEIGAKTQGAWRWTRVDCPKCLAKKELCKKCQGLRRS